jgi:hypothetical protein
MSLTPISYLRSEVEELYEEKGSYLGAATALYERYPHLAKPNQLRSYIKTELTGPQFDHETIEANVQLAKANQRLSDQNRIAGKAFREHARIENAVTFPTMKQFWQNLRIHGSGSRLIVLAVLALWIQSAAALVVHLSDNHFNELVNLPTNRFDFDSRSQASGAFSSKG